MRPAGQTRVRVGWDSCGPRANQFADPCIIVYKKKKKKKKIF